MTDLTDILDGAWAHLYESAEIRDAGFRMAQLATVGTTGAPRLRTVVLRGVSQADRTVRIHTDVRSPKVAEIAARPDVSLVAYHRAGGQQVRIEGQATVHHQNEIAKTSWAGARAQSRICYRTAFAPGTALSRSDEADVTEAMRAPPVETLGFEHFCAIVITVRHLDWLDLAASGHRRAVFEWDVDIWRGAWVAP